MEIFILIIIFMVIMGFINKFSKMFQKNASEEQQRRTEHPIPYQDYKQPEVTRSDTDKQENFGDRRRHKVPENDGYRQPKEINPYSREEQMPYERAEQTPYEREKQTPFKRDNLTPYKKRDDAVVKADALLQLTRKEWAAGIVLSEVLGPPRAKRPHTTAGRYSFKR